MTPITFENFTDYPAGTEIEFNFGAYYPTVEGRITGYEILPAGKWEPAFVRLCAEYRDFETGETVKTTVRGFAEIGVGTYLIQAAQPAERKTASPWAA